MTKKSSLLFVFLSGWAVSSPLGGIMAYRGYGVLGHITIFLATRHPFEAYWVRTMFILAFGCDRAGLHHAAEWRWNADDSSNWESDSVVPHSLVRDNEARARQRESVIPPGIHVFIRLRNCLTVQFLLSLNVAALAFIPAGTCMISNKRYRRLTLHST
ncbi:hypothetical protein F5X96DRAFT_487072 [Biscogniauxia mediterranea]|nr:hypothetical protein F5X96DRAFT_487072 [Biscogniauxia mediterranea]